MRFLGNEITTADFREEGAVPQIAEEGRVREEMNAFLRAAGRGSRWQACGLELWTRSDFSAAEERFNSENGS